MSDLVTVFETGDPGLVAFVKSLLESAGVEYAAKGEGVQDVIGWGRFPGGTNVLAGPVQFQVSAEDAEEAKALLADLQREG